MKSQHCKRSLRKFGLSCQGRAVKQAPAKINQAFIFEGRNLYEPKLVRELGFTCANLR